MDVPQTITLIKDVLLAVAAIVTGSCAVIGLRRWQHEMQGKAEFETARKLIQCTYKVRDYIWNCRVPLVSGGEFPEGYNALDSTKSHKDEAEAWSFVFSNRWKPLIEAIQEFDTASLEAEALWGEEIRGNAGKLRVCLHNLRSAADAIVGNYLSGGEDFKSDRAFGVEMRKTAFASASDEKNPLTVQINAAISGIEEKVRPHLNRKR